MALTFPTSPTVGQVFTSGSMSWTWNGSQWDAVRAGVKISDTAPSASFTGDIWYNSSEGRSYIYYSNFWVELSPSLAGPAGADAFHPFLLGLL